MQTLFPLNIPIDVVVDLDQLAKRVSARSGLRVTVDHAEPGTNSSGINFESMSYVLVSNFQENLWGVEYNGKPGYFEWAVIQELAALGGDLGNSSVPPIMSGTWAEYQSHLREKKPWWKWW